MRLVFRDTDSAGFGGAERTFPGECQDSPGRVPGRTQDSPGKDLAEKGPFGSQKDVPERIWPRKALLVAKKTSREGFHDLARSDTSRQGRPTLAETTEPTETTETADSDTLRA